MRTTKRVACCRHFIIFNKILNLVDKLKALRLLLIMKIIERLKHLSEIDTDEVKIDLKLYNLADNLEKKARNHLKRIITILSEFDIHDEKHSEKVIENIEDLLGDKTIDNLSSYELFLLHLSAFFHDCAMAPSDW